MKKYAFLYVILPLVSFGQSASNQSGFFSSADPLTLSIVADLKSVVADVGDYPDDHAAILYLNSQDTFHIQIRPRGSFRKNANHCSFPPLRVNFKKKEVKKTVFEGEDKLKLVTHCTSDSDGEARVLKEYLAYHMYSLLSPVHFKTRLVYIHWIDQENRSDTITKPAFFIESDESMAKRYEGKIIEVQNINPQFTEPYHMLIMAMFQYMIGNTDWSIKALHNVKLLATSGKPPIPIPHDFDFSGLVNAPYAIPAPHLPINSVTERYYNGHCKSPEEVDSVIRLFLQQRPALIQSVKNIDFQKDSDGLQTQNYIDSFFELVNKGEAREVFLTKCRND